MINIHRVAGGLDIPPSRTAADQEGHDDEAAYSSENGSTSAVWRCDGSRFQASVTDCCCDDAGHADDQEETKDPERDAKAVLHLQRRESDSGHRNRDGLIPS